MQGLHNGEALMKRSEKPRMNKVWVFHPCIAYKTDSYILNIHNIKTLYG
jgi:hypothetical protein